MTSLICMIRVKARTYEIPTIHRGDLACSNFSRCCESGATGSPSNLHEAPGGFRTRAQSNPCKDPQQIPDRARNDWLSIPRHCQSSAGIRPRCHLQPGYRHARIPRPSRSDWHGWFQVAHHPREIVSSFPWEFHPAQTRSMPPSPTPLQWEDGGPPTCSRPPLQTS